MIQTEIPVPEQLEEKDHASSVELLYDSAFITKAAECVKHAKRRVYICAYAWRWYENSPEKSIQKFNYEIARRSKLGLDVRAILNQKTQADYLKQYGISTKSYPTDRAMHTKALLVDDDCLIIGSHNLTERGTAENYEVSVLVREPQACMLFAEYFEKMWQNYGE